MEERVGKELEAALILREMSTLSKNPYVETKKRKHGSISTSSILSNRQTAIHGFSQGLNTFMTIDYNAMRAVTPPISLINSLSQQVLQNRSITPAHVATACALRPVYTNRQQEQQSRQGVYVTPDVSPHQTPKRTSGNIVCSTTNSSSNGSKNKKSRYLNDEILKPLAPPPKMFNFKNFLKNEDSLNTLSLLSKKNNPTAHHSQNHTQKLAPISNMSSHSILKSRILKKKTENVHNSISSNLLLELKQQEAEHLRFLKNQALTLPYPIMQQDPGPIFCQAVGHNFQNNVSLLMRKATQVPSLPSSTKCTPVNVPALPSSQEETVNSSSFKKKKICKMEDCNTPADKRTPYCVKHRGQRKCEFKECAKFAQSKTRFCIKHGGGRRCKFPNCNKGARDKVFCGAHGGGKRCKNVNCTKLAVGGDEHCTAHGGGKRCQEKGCTKSAQSSSHFCVRHGGGKKCKIISCQKVARGKLGVCMAHSTAEKDKQVKQI